MSGIHGDSKNPRSHARRKPPPNYRSRSVQLHLFVLVAALMAVLVAMNEARKPATWAWLFGRQQPSAAVRIDSRLIPSAESTETSGTVQKPIANIMVQRDDITNEPAILTDLDNQWRRAWGQIYGTLSNDVKQQLARLLRATRLDRTPSAEDLESWNSLVNGLDQKWSGYFRAQHQSLLNTEGGLAPGHKEFALAVLGELTKRWEEQDKPALRAAIERRSWTEGERQVLSSVQAILDESDLAAVRDDTVWRPEEREAWFRLLERLQSADEQSLARQSVGDVGFVQIFRQSQEYRGRMVTVRGTIWRAYRVAAPPNDLGITGYYLLWLRPADGTNLPIVVYALELPPGFPPLADEQVQLRHEVEVHGFFVKRWVYRAQDGLNSAPLLLAKAPRLIPTAVTETSGIETWTARQGKSLWMVVAGIGIVLAGLAATLAWLASWSSRPSVTASLLHREEELVDWDELPHAPTVEESLRRLEKEAS